MEAQMNLGVKAGAQLDLQGGAMANLKAPLVKIN
jgi:hypothetical protein